MMERECVLQAFVLDYAKKLLADIPEGDMGIQPAPGLNTPLWIAGHLAMAADFGSKLLGAPTSCPTAWYKTFGPGSDPVKIADPPSKAEALRVLEASMTGLSAAAKSASAEKLAGPHGFGPMEKATPTLGDFVAHLMTTHACSHLGQLSAWRRLRGLPAVLGF